MLHFNQRINQLFAGRNSLATLKDSILEHQQDFWLVGGTIRDLLRDTAELSDIDICASGDPTQLAQAWAQSISGRWFWLDEERKQSRVLLADKMTVDFAPLRAATIIEDLRARDFTVNAIALPFDREMVEANLVDPLDGKTDLLNNELIFCSDKSITDDPLRMLKGIRHAVTLGLDFNESLVSQSKKHSTLLTSISAERVRDELGIILSSDHPVCGLRLMYSTEIMSCLFGSACSSWNADACFSELSDLVVKMKDFNGDDREQVVNELYNSRSLFLLSSLLSTYKPDNLDELLHSRLRLSRQHQKLIKSLITPPSSKWLEQIKMVASSRQKALLVEQLGYFPDEQLLYISVCKELFPLDLSRDLLIAYYEHQRLGRIPDLISGHQLKEMLHGQPDGEIGKWTNKIKHAEIEGIISSQDDVFRWCRSELSN